MTAREKAEKQAKRKVDKLAQLFERKAKKAQKRAEAEKEQKEERVYKFTELQEKRAKVQKTTLKRKNELEKLGFKTFQKNLKAAELRSPRAYRSLMDRSARSCNPNEDGDDSSCFSKASPPSVNNFLTAEEEYEIREKLEKFGEKLQRGTMRKTMQDFSKSTRAVMLQSGPNFHFPQTPTKENPMKPESFRKWSKYLMK